MTAFSKIDVSHLNQGECHNSCLFFSRYFRQLQELSDTVRDIEWEGPVTEAIAETYTEEDDITKNMNKHHARRRYLENLANNDAEDEEDNCCILCRSEFTRGFITQWYVSRYYMIVIGDVDTLLCVAHTFIAR